MKAIDAKPLTEKEIIERIYLYNEMSQQIIKPLVYYLGLCQPAIVLRTNGEIERVYPQEFINLKKQIDECLALLRDQIFGDNVAHGG